MTSDTRTKENIERIRTAFANSSGELLQVPRADMQTLLDRIAELEADAATDGASPA